MMSSTSHALFGTNPKNGREESLLVTRNKPLLHIASYVLKAEKGKGELLKQAAKEAEHSNTRQQLNKLGSVFLTNQEVSEQEAVYRVLSMPLRRCSRSVVFINTDNKESRDALLLPFSQLQKLDDDNEDIYCKNIIDQYAARPKHCEDMCLAQFTTNEFA